MMPNEGLRQVSTPVLVAKDNLKQTKTKVTLCKTKRTK